MIAALPRALVDERIRNVEVLECPELAYLIAAARDAAWMTHCNVRGLRYLERKDAVARLRGALAAYDRALQAAAG